jgi:NADPH:quinone reductase-like Zn-dependent oxidoreductase
MRAAIIIKHGKPEGVQIREVQKPLVGKNEILVKIIATTVTAGDAVLRRQSFIQFLLFYPLARLLFGVKNQRKKILGHEFSGVVESVGENVSKFHVGNAVFGTTGFKGGGHAEYISLPEDGIIALKPEDFSFEEAAALPIGSICALHLLKKLNIQSGNKVLIYGASGSIGTYAVQLAKHFGAKVTGVCSKKNIELVESLGADIEKL